jgi:hypothetical protein
MNLEQAMTGIKVGEPSVYGGLAVFPLIGKNNGKRDYLTLSEAFGEKGIEISEVSEGGSVPELRLKNGLDKDVFAADGEALLGAKQNRVLNSSIYVKAKSEIVIPVSCVEQGRWRYQRRDFQASEHSEFLSSRAAKMGSVASRLKMTGTDRRSDQGAVWEAMSAKCADFGADAPTRSMADIYEAGRPSLEKYVEHFRPQPDQVGLACAINGDTAGIEMFEDAGVFNQFFEKLLRAYAAEVVFESKIATMVPDKGALEDLLDRVAKSRWDEYPAVGSGKELRFKLGELNGSALDVDGRLLHLVLLRNTSRTRH